MRLRPSRRRVYRTLLWLMLLFVLAPVVVAYPFGPWAQDTIYVYDANSGQHASLESGIKGWNRADVGIRFQMTRDVRQANVVVKSFKKRTDLRTWCRPLHDINPRTPGGNMTACVDWQGYKPFRQIRMAVFDQSRGSVDPDIIVHELGHVIGLGHQDDRNACTVMTPTFSTDQGCFGRDQPSQKIRVAPCVPGAVNRILKCRIDRMIPYSCGPGRDDVQRARILYGALENKTAWKPWCYDIVPMWDHGFEDQAKTKIVAQRYTWFPTFAFDQTTNPGSDPRTCRGWQDDDDSVVIYEEPAPKNLRRQCGIDVAQVSVPNTWLKAAVNGEADLQSRAEVRAGIALVGP